MAQNGKDTPSWISPVVHIGMALTIPSVFVAHFFASGTWEMILVGIAIFGIILSMAPFWARNNGRAMKDLWRQARRDAKVRDPWDDLHLSPRRDDDPGDNDR
ncbi:MAG: hypothetical protein AAFY35_19105 [Pseudomonadota bacterium]